MSEDYLAVALVLSVCVMGYVVGNLLSKMGEVLKLHQQNYRIDKLKKQVEDFEKNLLKEKIKQGDWE